MGNGCGSWTHPPPNTHTHMRAPDTHLPTRPLLHLGGAVERIVFSVLQYPFVPSFFLFFRRLSLYLGYFLTTTQKPTTARASTKKGLLGSTSNPPSLNPLFSQHSPFFSDFWISVSLKFLFCWPCILLFPSFLAGPDIQTRFSVGSRGVHAMPRRH